ncbi:hypothetical protein HU200_055713 [Digitaria exilis]|uniref:Uncharacterized protein n=1 Tax=Digitaria exilis TaxID=1010633 RepID=A0A835AMQ7_9POAL|nr:hypothetical protein HU200_055713 [Digitaria exilis]
MVMPSYAGMLARGGRPDAYTFPSLLKAVAYAGRPRGGVLAGGSAPAACLSSGWSASPTLRVRWSPLTRPPAAARGLLDACGQAVRGVVPLVRGHGEFRLHAHVCLGAVGLTEGKGLAARVAGAQAPRGEWGVAGPEGGERAGRYVCLVRRHGLSLEGV